MHFDLGIHTVQLVRQGAFIEFRCQCRFYLDLTETPPPTDDELRAWTFSWNARPKASAIGNICQEHALWLLREWAST